MSVEVAPATHAHGHHGDVAHQYEQIDQQNESYIVGMWTFLVTEIMFFGALFLCYTLYRSQAPGVFFEISRHVLNVPLGALNTTFLLTSSFSMALAVYHAQQKNRNLQLLFLAITIAFSCGFLVIKGFEWAEKFHDHHVMGPDFHYDAPLPDRAHIPPKTAAGKDVGYEFQVHDYQAQMYFCLYFGMTGLHAVHVIIGMIVMSILWIMIFRRHRAVQYYMPVEMTGLYWHFVDIVWIFLFPLFYLIPHP
ncbi:MAG TPA: cytochrome c oxidase subunit 3 [Chthonomonadaceae bacterium]|nr:cytochrome c oxidase subunit 3 [Chthonomonadaceae bacterium]